jgi:hypothetical protein
MGGVCDGADGDGAHGVIVTDELVYTVMGHWY